ncbi:11024_t:CDS:2, partial [Entrophospora sp. SA101]
MDGYWYGHEESYDYVYMTHEVSGIVSLDSKLIGFGILSVGGVDGVRDPEIKYQKFTEDAKEKASRNNNLDLTWELNITQFCQVHYMSHIMNEYKKNDGDIEDVDMITDDIEDVDVISEHTFKDKLNDGEKIYEIDFINSVKSMVKIFLKREKKEDKPPIYDWTLLRESLESEDDKLIPFLNMLEKLINPNDRNLAEQTITQRQKGLSFLCYFLAGIGNKQISAIRKDIAMFLDQSGTTNQAIDTFSSIQLSSSSRENRREKNAIALIHKENVAKELSNYQDNAINVNVDDYHNIHGLRMPTTTSTSDVYHMTTILAIPIPEARAVPNDAIHNPLLIDCDSLIFQIENRYMSLLSQSYNNRFANQLTLSEDDLFDSLVSYCYDAEIHEKKEERQLKNTLLIDFIHLELKSAQSYIEAMK